MCSKARVYLRIPLAPIISTLGGLAHLFTTFTSEYKIRPVQLIDQLRLNMLAISETGQGRVGTSSSLHASCFEFAEVCAMDVCFLMMILAHATRKPLIEVRHLYSEPRSWVI